MPKSQFKAGLAALLALGFAAQPAPASAPILGPDAASCRADAPAVLVRLSGFKAASGTVKVSLYGEKPEQWMKKGMKLDRVKVPVQSTGPIDVCIKVPRPGTYAIGVHHDLNGNAEFDRKDGGGFSNNPKLTVLDRKPSHKEARFSVGNGTKHIGITLKYLQGLSIKPAA